MKRPRRRPLSYCWWHGLYLRSAARRRRRRTRLRGFIDRHRRRRRRGVLGDGAVRARNGVYLHLTSGVLQASQISFSPPLTDDRVACLNRLGVARYTKVWLTWEEPWWRSDPGRPFIICVDEGDTHMSSIMCEDVSTSSEFVLEACLAGSDADAFDADPQRGLAAVLTRLGVAFGATYPGPPYKTDATAWQGDPFSRGAYSFWRVGARATDVAEVGESHCDRCFSRASARPSSTRERVRALESGSRAAREAEAALDTESATCCSCNVPRRRSGPSPSRRSRGQVPSRPTHPARKTGHRLFRW